MPLERNFDTAFVAPLANAEKQIQQSYRPVIGVHKWFARRPGTLFRSLLLAEFIDETPLSQSFFRGHSLKDITIADPFMGGGTPLIEANRLGCRVIGFDINPMAYWIVRQELSPLDLNVFRTLAQQIISATEKQIGRFYYTQCTICDNPTAIVKYFLWVKQQPCAHCNASVDLFPGYLVATNQRHPSHVLVCSTCGHLNELSEKPDTELKEQCTCCDTPLKAGRPAQKNKFDCPNCGKKNKYPDLDHMSSPPQHRLFALEYHCDHCKPGHSGRFFKKPDGNDLRRFAEARNQFCSSPPPDIPVEEIPSGDETDRLHRWGYRYYRDLFNERQLLGLSTLLLHIRSIEDRSIRHALATVFSDTLRYQNMLCRYDTWALKCQDIFSVHGFPVGLIQCENNLLGIPKIGSGGYRHFVEKYERAKSYCENPFEISRKNSKKQIVYTAGEQIEAEFVDRLSDLKTNQRTAFIAPVSGNKTELPENSLDGVFTDPPYFSNVQYAELMDFCFVWLRLLLQDEVPAFRFNTTRSADEVTGNLTMGRGLAEFTRGLANIFKNMAHALKPDAPFVFTYHHNQLDAYTPLVVAILDSNLDCTATLASPAEMGASLHINGTSSSKIDTIFVCREVSSGLKSQSDRIKQVVSDTVKDISDLRKGSVSVSPGDITCIALGHLTRYTINCLRSQWSINPSMAEKIDQVRQTFDALLADSPLNSIVDDVMQEARKQNGNRTQPEETAALQLELPGMDR